MNRMLEKNTIDVSETPSHTVFEICLLDGVLEFHALLRGIVPARGRTDRSPLREHLDCFDDFDHRKKSIDARTQHEQSRGSSSERVEVDRA